MENANLAVLSSDRALDKALPCTWYAAVLLWKSYTRMVPLCSVDGRLQEKGRLLWSLFSSLAANSRSADHLAVDVAKAGIDFRIDRYRTDRAVSVSKIKKLCFLEGENTLFDVFSCARGQNDKWAGSPPGGYSYAPPRYPIREK